MNPWVIPIILPLEKGEEGDLKTILMQLFEDKGGGKWS